MKPYRFTEHTNEIDLDLKPFINFLIVIIPVLMISAEFSNTSIIKAAHSTGGSTTDSAQTTPPVENSRLNLTLIVSDSVITIATAHGLLPSFVYKNLNPLNGASSYDFEQIKQTLMQIHSRYRDVADKNKITIASEPDVVYDKIIQLMDVAREAEYDDIGIAKVRI